MKGKWKSLLYIMVRFVLVFYSEGETEIASDGRQLGKMYNIK